MRAPPRLWLCADLGHPNAPDLLDRVRAALAAGTACVWLRVPRALSARALLDAALALREVTAASGSWLVVGERLDIATVAGADGVHLPSHGLPAREVRAATSLAVSAAAHDEREVDEAAPHADVLVVSPFGEVPGKGPALGAARFRALRARAPGRFVVALGGVATADDAREALGAGADGVAVRRVLLDAVDPAEACRALHHALTPT